MMTELLQMVKGNHLANCITVRYSIFGLDMGTPLRNQRKQILSSPGAFGKLEQGTSPVEAAWASSADRAWLGFGPIC